MVIGELEARKQIVYYSRKTHAQGLVCATDGNLSVRLSKERFLITPSGIRKEDVTIDDLLVIDSDGNPVGDTRRPSTEYKVHLEAYRRRDDISAVIHAHPPKSIAFTLTKTPLDTCILPEVVVTLGDVPVAPYATPSTDDLPGSMSDLIAVSDVVMLARHGSVTVGATMAEAFKKLEKLEHNAEILIYAHMLGGAQPFSHQEIHRLQGLRDFYGIQTKVRGCGCRPEWNDSKAACSGGEGECRSPGENPEALSPADLETLVDEIVRRVREAL
ncbi:class II aldolase/adducin family protein [Alkalispirochaeta alkalica]|uniref:class II aldolase/adducin family protein n=1 Tax=Alkalispirochaeta alkalica TaxID=46356 RepID=UPI000374787A|nr:class II aldolase/adducin family protein [Alkalispirochaeta alkalica]